MSSVKVFQCPNCKEYVASDAKSCRFCSAPLDSQSVQRAVEAQTRENKTYRKRHYQKHMGIGFVVFAVGVAITVGTYLNAASSPRGGRYLITYGLIFVGGGDFLYGLAGWIGELSSKE
jgi:hypothetical protein